MLCESDIVITDIVRVLHPVGRGSGDISSYTQEGGVHTHEIILRLSGESDSKFDETYFHTVKGDIKYLPMGKGSLAHESWGDTGECINIFFYADKRLSENAFVVSGVHFDEFKRLFEKAEMLWLKKDVGYRYETIAVLYRILALLKKEQDRDNTSHPHYAKIKSSVDFLDLNFRSLNIDYNEVAALSNMSYSYFRRLFCTCMGIPPARYVVDKKIEYAKEMLSSHQYSIGEVSDAVGFKDIYYFSHVFKKMTGVAPSQFDEI